MKRLLILSDIGLCVFLSMPLAHPQTQPASAAKDAVVLSIEGSAEYSHASTVSWSVARTNQTLKIGDRFRTREKSRATVRLGDLSVLRLAESTAIEIEAPSNLGGRPNLKLDVGSGFFHSRDKPQENRVRTPLVSAAIRGTEFHLLVGSDGSTELTLIDGEVDLRNPFGQLQLKSGEQAIVRTNERPKFTAVIETINIIQWALYYPGIIYLADLGLKRSDDQRINDSIAAYEQGDLLQAAAHYPPDRTPLSAPEILYAAALELSVGRIDPAKRLLSQIPANDPKAIRVAQSLQKLIAAVKFQLWETSGSPDSVTEWMAESYYQQSRSNLKEALRAARTATERGPGFGFAWSRLGELEFSFGRTASAMAATERALQLSPRNPEAMVLKGFLLAARNNVEDAIASFNSAIQIDPALGNAWLGRGLCRVRQGNSDSGRLDLQTAAALEPQRSILRSYLGKAFANVNDPENALKELTLAKQFDPRDPTPWLYSALLHQTENRVNPAISDLEKSQALNNNRRIFRSALLIDQDRASRSANLASIYRDAGMPEISVREASRAVNFDYANYSAHYFLANSYDALRDPRQINLRYETPWFNELLLANLLSPVGGGSLSPNISQQEYSRLLERDRFGLASSTEYFSGGDWIQSGSQFGTFGNSSYALDALYRSEQGQRPNNDLSQLTVSAKVKQQITPADSVYFQAIYYDFDAGDVVQYYNQNSAHQRLRVNENQEPILLAGYHHEWAPGVHTLFLTGRLHDALEVSDPDQSVLVLSKNPAGQVTGVSVLPSPLKYRSEFEAYTAELQQIWQQEKNTLVTGARYQAGGFDSRSQFEKSVIEADLDRLSFYAYDHYQLVESFWLTLGLSYDRLVFPANHRTAPLTGREETNERLSPKAGFIWSPSKGTTIRGGYTRSLGGVSYDQSFRLEPVQVAGFNQAYRSLIPESISGSIAGAEFETWGLAWDQKWATGTYVGVEMELLRSDADRELGAITATGFPPVVRASGTAQQLDFEEKNLTVTLHQLLGDNWSVGGRYRLSDADLATRFPEIPISLTSGARSAESSLLHQMSLTATYNHRSGFFASAEALWSAQSNRGYRPARVGDDFWHFNLFSGYRFYHRRAEARVGLLNLGDRDYRLNPLNFYRELPRERTLTASLRLNF